MATLISNIGSDSHANAELLSKSTIPGFFSLTPTMTEVSAASGENEQVREFMPEPYNDDTILDSSHESPEEEPKDEKVPRADPELDGKPYYRYLAPDRPLPEIPGDLRDYQIAWLGPDDKGTPVNWPTLRKLRALILCSSTATVTAFGSAISSTTADGVMKEFHVGLPVAMLNTSLYVLGFALGPVLWGPMSEQVGRKPPQLLGMLGLTLFSFASATAKDFQTLVLTRFFGGVLSSSSLATSPAVPADMYGNSTRGRAIAIVSLTICAGPMIAPVVGGYIVNSFLGWRWCFYILGIFASLVLTLIFFFLEETYPPVLLVQRAQEVRDATENWAVSAPLEGQHLDFRALAERTLMKPFKMLAVEPILFLLSLYHGFIYGILYLCLEAVPLIFTSYGWPGGNVYLPYLGMFVGTVIVILANIFYFEPVYNKTMAKSDSKINPEARLPPMMVSGVVFTCGIFLLCWSGAYHVMWFVPTLGCAFIGFGLIGIFMAAFNYIIDTYLPLAASGLAANTFFRSAMGCAFPLFATPMFKNLGTQWAGTLLGCLAAILAPVPFLFYVFGKQIRQKSIYAFDMEALEEKLSRPSTRNSNAP